MTVDVIPFIWHCGKGTTLATEKDQYFPEAGVRRGSTTNRHVWGNILHLDYGGYPTAYDKNHRTVHFILLKIF